MQSGANVLQLQPRDVALLRGLFECRVMTAKHAAALFFNGKGEATKKRLQKLKAAGFIGTRQRQAFELSVLFLTRKGLVLLQQEGVLNNYPPFDLPALDRRARVSDLTIRHELEVIDVKTAFHTAIQAKPRFQIERFSTWPLLNEFKAMRPGGQAVEVLVKPDGFIRLHETDADGKFEHIFFLEVDRSSETLEVLVTRAGCYLDYYRSGGYAVRNGADRSAYKDFPFRVLMVFKTAERRNNTAERLLQCNPPILTQVCMSTSQEVTSDPLGAIWIRPAEYREATRNTPFDVEPPGRQFAYRRNAEREAFIESRIAKVRLLQG